MAGARAERTLPQPPRGPRAARSGRPHRPWREGPPPASSPGPPPRPPPSGPSRYEPRRPDAQRRGRPRRGGQSRAGGWGPGGRPRPSPCPGDPPPHHGGPGLLSLGGRASPGAGGGSAERASPPPAQPPRRRAPLRGVQSRPGRWGAGGGGGGAAETGQAPPPAPPLAGGEGGPGLPGHVHWLRPPSFQDLLEGVVRRAVRQAQAPPQSYGPAPTLLVRAGSRTVVAAGLSLPPHSRRTPSPGDRVLPGVGPLGLTRAGAPRPPRLREEATSSILSGPRGGPTRRRVPGRPSGATPCGRGAWGQASSGRPGRSSPPPHTQRPRWRRRGRPGSGAPRGDGPGPRVSRPRLPLAAASWV